MIIRTHLMVALLTFGHCSYGQDSINQNGQRIIIRDSPSKVKYLLPLFIIKGDSNTCYLPTHGLISSSKQAKRTFKKFNTDAIQSFDVINRKEAIDKYGELGKYGVVIINMKAGTYLSLSRKLKRWCR